MDDTTGVLMSSGSSGDDGLGSYHLPRPLPMWLNSAYAKHIVKGNFMTLSARPKTVEPGEWIAHQGKSSFLRCGVLGLIKNSGRTLSQLVELRSGDT